MRWGVNLRNAKFQEARKVLEGWGQTHLKDQERRKRDDQDEAREKFIEMKEAWMLELRDVMRDIQKEEDQERSRGLPERN
jgi:hypothetical protein